MRLLYYAVISIITKPVTDFYFKKLNWVDKKQKKLYIYAIKKKTRLTFEQHRTLLISE